MTDRRHGFGAGSSLLHARKAHLHQHQQRTTHKVNRRHNNNNESDNIGPRDSSSAVDSESLADQLQVKPRQPELPGAAPTVADVTIVQTVSVVEYLDDAGATVSVETLASPPVTLGPTEPSPSPLPIPPLPDLTSDGVSVPRPTPTPSQADENAGAALPEPTPKPAPSTQTEPPVPAESSPGPQPPVTSAPLPTASPPGFTPPSGFNSTSAGVAPHFNNSTLSANSFTNSSSTASFRALSSISASESSSTSTFSSTFTSDTTSSLSNPTDLSNPGLNPGFNPAGVPAPQPPSSTTIAPFATAATPETPTSTVVASVVGSVAGAALIVLAAFFLLRYRRRRGGHLYLPGESGSRALPSSSGPSGPSGDSAAAMSERSHNALPFAIPATLAALTRGPKRLSAIPEPSVAHATPPTTAGTAAPASPERGFYRVSGKKLPSVMAHGGDGFTDPRQSTMSGASSFYRDSTDMITRIGTTAGPPRFAVGTPMRPESGIPVFQPGPARTPVRTPITAEGSGGNPFDDVHELSPPNRQRDGVGRSLIGEDGSRGSRGSGSRFMEAL